MERRSAETGGSLVERVFRFLHQQAHQILGLQGSIDVLAPRDFGCQDTCFTDMLEGVSRIHAQTIINARGAIGFAKLYLSKIPITAVDILDERALPFCTMSACSCFHRRDTGPLFWKRESSTIRESSVFRGRILQGCATPTGVNSRGISTLELVKKNACCRLNERVVI